jgi:transposase
MNPQKLSNFTKNKLLPDESKKYLHHIVEVEMPTGLKKYLELELFLHVQMKVSRGISLRTACRWLHKEGFKYTMHKKALYFDGHEHEDVIEYQQNVFLPLIKEHMK